MGEELSDDRSQAARDIADRLAIRPAEITARENDLDEIEDLRAALVERTQAANERVGEAARLVERSRVRLVEATETRARADSALTAAHQRAATIVADAEARAATVQEHAEQQALSRIRKAEREATDRVMRAETEAQRLIAEADLVLEQAEVAAAETRRNAAQAVEEMIETATRSRHESVERLRAREHEVEERIRSLLAETGDLSALRVEPARSTSTGADPAEPAIDLTDTPAAVGDTLDEWVERRDAG